MTYNADGTVATRQDGLKQVTRYDDYKLGVPRKITYADGSWQSAVVSNIGLIDSVTVQTSATGSATTAYRYDAMGRLALITYPADDTVKWNPTSLTFTKVQQQEYDLLAGHWRQVIATGSGKEVNYFDAMWRPVYTERYDDADRANTMRIIKREYDFADRPTYESYPRRVASDIGDGVHRSFDALGRVTLRTTDSELGSLYQGTGYLDGFIKVVTDERHNSRYYAYQAFDDPSEEAIAHIWTPEGVEVAIDRDVFGKPKSITRSGGGKSATRSYVYDSAERLCKTIEPETRSTVQDYDAAGNVAWRAPGLAIPTSSSCDTVSVTAANKISYAYDKLNRLTTTTFGDGSPAITRTYTADGLPYTIISNGAVWTNTYNKRRLNEQESLAYGGVTYNYDRRYDANGSLLQVRYPLDMTWIGYNPNALGEPRQVGTYATSITYHPNGAVASFKYGNGIAHSLSLNKRGLPEWSQDVGVLKDNYGYDESGNVVAIADWQEGITNRGIEYDNLDRVVHVNSPKLWGDAWYTYDALDNITSSRMTAGSTARKLTHTIDAATNRLTSITNSAGTSYNLGFAYDNLGNVKQRGEQSFVFDLGNRLKSAAGKGTYAYDGLGHRVSVVGTDGVNRIHVYSQEGHLLFVKPSNASAGTKYVHLHGHVIAEITGSTVQYDHTDGLGSLIAQSNAGGALLNRTRYEPYGAIASGNAGKIGFTGQVNDSDTGLIYMQQRYYDPIAGRFLSIDPVVTDANTGGSFNRYAYANNSPYKYLDPDGRQIALASCGLGPGGCLFGIVATIVGAKAVADTVHAAESHSGGSTSGDKGNTNQAGTDGGKSDTQSGSAGANTNPYKGPVTEPVVVVDQHGNAIPVDQGQKVNTSPSGDFQQVVGSDGKATGDRMDRGGHPKQNDPSAQKPHGHRSGVTRPDGNPHLPIEPKSP
jgi:RHS repeat-associated protein